MPRTCGICKHTARTEIEAALIRGEPFRNIAERFGTSSAALFRHRESHLPQVLTKAQAIAEVTRADSLLDEVHALRRKALEILTHAEAAGDLRTALSAVREARGCVELLAKVMGELDERPTVSILVDRQWLRLRGIMFRALEPFPQAKQAVAQALAEGDVRDDVG